MFLIFTLIILNIDWFQPFKRTEYSVGAIYAIVQNLPREKRFKEENIILINQPNSWSKKTKSINRHLLKPLINELTLQVA